MTAAAQRIPDLEQRLAALEATDDDIAGTLCAHALDLPEDGPWYAIKDRRGPQHTLFCCRDCAARHVEIEYWCEYAERPDEAGSDLKKAATVVPFRSVGLCHPAAPVHDHGQRIPTGIGGSDRGGLR